MRMCYLCPSPTIKPIQRGKGTILQGSICPSCILKISKAKSQQNIIFAKQFRPNRINSYSNHNFDLLALTAHGTSTGAPPDNTGLGESFWQKKIIFKITDEIHLWHVISVFLNCTGNITWCRSHSNPSTIPTTSENAQVTSSSLRP